MSTEKLQPEGLLGRKLGMTHIFTGEGQAVPVTIIEAGPCFVLEVKNKKEHGYSAVQLGFGPKKFQRVDKALKGHFEKAGKGSFYHVKEMRCDVEALKWETLGQEIKVADVFKDGEMVDIAGVSIGRGFAGVMKRHKMKGQPSTRGTHETRRNVGSIGCRKFPGHIFKNKRMPGHMGDVNVTIQNLKVMGIRAEQNVILVKGGIPGARGSLVVIRKAIKSYKQKAA